MKKYNLNKPEEFGRILFALGYPEYGYTRKSADDQAKIASGWNVEYQRNKVRMLKRHEDKPVPSNLQHADQPCINLRVVDRKLVRKAALVAGCQM